MAAANEKSAPHPADLITELYARLKERQANLVTPNCHAQSLPPSLHDFLAHLTGILASGHSVTIMHGDARATTLQAGQMLGVSRQFLIRELEGGKLPHHRVGTHRYIYARDVPAYKAARDQHRRQILNGLTQWAVAENLYDRAPPTDHAA